MIIVINLRQEGGPGRNGSGFLVETPQVFRVPDNSITLIDFGRELSKGTPNNRYCALECGRRGAVSGAGVPRIDRPRWAPAVARPVGLNQRV